MDILRNKQLLGLLDESLKADDLDENLITTSAMLRPSQLEMIRQLARANRLSQGDIVRVIIDEWCESKLKPGGC